MASTPGSKRLGTSSITSLNASPAESPATLSQARSNSIALQLNRGSPVLAVTRTAYDPNGTPVETNDMVLAGDRYELIYELPAD
ncbi:MAG: UTRA domain-containing protein [Pseudonocardiales bacterium]